MGWRDDLWHFTCLDHGWPGINESGVIRPNRHPLIPMMPAVIWLTDLMAPRPEDCGLTSQFIQCNRTEVRLRVGAHVQTWEKAKRRWGIPPSVVADLERFGRSDRWFVAYRPTAVWSVVLPEEVERVLRAATSPE